MTGVRRLLVGIPTLRRPELLRNLLGELPHLVPVPGLEVEFLVADNTVSCEWRDLVAECSLETRIPIVYVHEARQGLSFVRNRILQEAIERNANFLVFFDDDQTPHREVIGALLAMRDREAADVVLGSVRARFHRPAKRWMTNGGFFDICRHRDGERLEYADTSNVLVDLDVVRKLGIWFDEKFNFSGGEDTFFFKSIHRRGGRIVFAAAAIMYENIIDERATLRWLMQRWRWTGNTCARIDMKLNGEAGRRWRVLVGGLGRMAAGAFLTGVACAALAIGRFEVVARQLRIVCRGFGFVEAAFGIHNEAYRQPSH